MGDSRPSAFGRITEAASQFLNGHGIYLGRRSTRLHVALYRRSGGRIGDHLPGWPRARIALVNHRGAKSGRERTSPLMYHEEGEAIAVVASKAGEPTNPAWYHNLLANPLTTVEIGRERRPVRARPANASECERLWPKFVALYPGYEWFRERAKPREIPVVLLEPRRPG